MEKGGELRLVDIVIEYVLMVVVIVTLLVGLVAWVGIKEGWW